MTITLADVYQKRAEKLAGRNILKEKKESTTQMLVFSLRGGQTYAMELHHMIEIRSFKKWTSVPTGPDALIGLINLKGEIRCVFDLSVLIGREGPSNGTEGYILLLKENEMGLKVDGIDRIYQITEAEMTASQSQPFDLRNDYARGLLHQKTIWLDVHKLLKHSLLSITNLIQGERPCRIWV